MKLVGTSSVDAAHAEVSDAAFFVSGSRITARGSGRTIGRSGCLYWLSWHSYIDVDLSRPGVGAHYSSTMTDDARNVLGALATISERWQPHRLTSINDYDLKVGLALAPWRGCPGRWMGAGRADQKWARGFLFNG